MRLQTEILWEKLKNLFRKNKTPKEGVDYKFHHFENTDLSGIHLLRGEYRDVIYYYVYAKFSESDGYPKLSYNYEIFKTGNLTQEQLIADEKFAILVGDILTELLVNNETRADNTEEPDLL
jgi:hypothetical protein